MARSPRNESPKQRSIWKRIQAMQLSAVRRASTAIARLLAPLPSVPFADRLPPAKRVVNANFDRARRLLEEQRKFALKLVDAAEPIRKEVGARRKPARRKKAEPKLRPVKNDGGARAEGQRKAS